MKDLMATYGNALFTAVAVHMFYVKLSVLSGFLLGVVLGIVLSRMQKWSRFILPLLSVFQTIPGLVFLGLLFLWLGMKSITVIIALSVYAMFPVLKNTYTALVSVEEKYIEAAAGCGMSSFQILTRVELPLALPVIFAGLRLSAVYTISWAVLASMIGLGGLGDFIYQGTTSNNNLLILLGAVPAGILAVIVGFLIDWLKERVISPGVRKAVQD